MAKIKRIMRKIAPADRSFDEQLWPIYLALIVLGGYLAGIVLAVLRFDEPRIWANAITWLLLIPVTIGGLMALLAWFDSRKVNRRTLLCVVLALIVNFVMASASTRVYWVRFFKTTLAVGPETRERYQKIIPEYQEFQLNPQTVAQPDFLKPVETKDPQPEPEKIDRQEVEPEEAQAKPEEAEVPAEEKPEVKPNEVERKIAETSAPRRSETASKLSRQETQFKPKAAAAAATVKVDTPAEKQPSQAEAKPTEVARQTSQSQATKKPSEVEPTTTAEAEKVEVARRESTPQEVAQNTSAPTLTRNMETPKTLPNTTAVAQEVTAPFARETDAEQVKPSTTAATKQETKTTEVAEKPTEPTPDTPAEVAQASTTRQQLADRMPELAASAKPVPNRRTPTIAQPQRSAVALAEATPKNAAQPTASQVRPSDTAVAKTSTAKPTPSRTPQPTDAPPEARPVEVAQATTQRAQSSDTPTANPQASPSKSPSRAVAQASANVATSAQAVLVAAAQPTESTNSPSPAGTSASKQTASTAAVAKASTEPAPSTPSAVAEISTTPQTRQQIAQSSPVMAQTAKPVVDRRTPTTANPSPSSISAAVTTPTKSPVQGDSPSPAPSSSTVARQSSQASATSTSPQALDAPTQSPSTELARAQAERAQTSSEPTINPAARPTNSPARSLNAADVAASTVAKAAPAASATTRATSNPSAEPARTALAKGFSGTAGVGQSKNMDRNAPAPDNTLATNASGSARRAEASQQMAAGPALSPSAPARIARAHAGGNAPSATLVAVAEAVNATASGSPQAAELQASASAALARQASNAAQGDVTADRGEIEVDLGSTKVVSENSTGKASGGGLPKLNFETRSHKLARSEVGGAPEVTLAVSEVAEMAQAPTGDGGGEPATPEASPEATALARTEAGGASPATGGPSMAGDPSAQSASSPQVAEAQVGRAETIEAAMGQPVTGGGSDSPERTATGPQLLANLVASAAEPVEMSDSPAGVPDGSPPLPSETELARAEGSGGAPTTGGPSSADAAGPIAEETGAEGGAEAALAEASVGRASAIESTIAKPAAGGGTGSPTRQSTGPAFAMTTKADEIALAGTPNSGGLPDGSPVEAQGADIDRAAAGIAGAASGEAAGALASSESLDAPPSGEVGDAPGASRASPAEVDGPQIGDTIAAAAPFKRSGEFNLPSGTVEQVAIAEVTGGTGGAAEGQPDVEAMMSGMDAMGMSRQVVAGGLPVDVAAPEGPGGIGEEVALDAGTMSRRSQEESQEVHFRDARFIRTRTGGPLSINVAADLGTRAFTGRSKLKNSDLLGEAGSSAQATRTEKSVELGLTFLARHQSSDGSWSLGNFGAGRRGYENERTALTSDTAATGLCLLTFLGAGYHQLDDKYKNIVAGGIDYLVKNQKDDGDLYVNQDPESSRAVWLYSHAIATIALCEAYGMTQDPDLREPAQKALDFIATSQNKDRGGWRYSPGVGSDTSVSGWMMMALKSGQLAGLDVKQETYDKINTWLNSAQGSSTERHLYVYNPLAAKEVQVINGREVDQSAGRDATKTMTSVGLLMRLYSGWKRDNADMNAGARYLMQHLPTNGTRLNNQRDTYYWYYATQVMFHMGGKYWEAWNERLHPLLTESQVMTGPMAGSWDPKGSIPDRWGPHAGRIYVTTLNLLSLEVAYRHLPIYEDTAK